MGSGDFHSDLQHLSLSASYQRLSELLGGVDAGAAAPPAQTQEAQHLLSHCEDLIERAALFSSNEDKDDLVTSHLKYLLVPFHKAELLSTHSSPDLTTRLQQLRAAHDAYWQYLQRCHQYGFLKGSVADAYAAEEAGAAPDPGTARNHRIERFKRSKAVNGLLQQLKSRCKVADEECGPPGGVAGWDEEDERHVWSLQLEAAAIKAMDSRPLLQQEMQLLQHAIKQQHEQQQQSHPQQQQQPQRGATSSSQDSRLADHPQQQQLQQQMMTKLADIAGQLSLGGDRHAARQQVFRPSHILPTLTVEQQGAIELAQAREREAQHKQAEAEAAARRAAAASDDDDEEELARSRAWDDFKDDNPRGWGNSKLRPCA